MSYLIKGNFIDLIKKKEEDFKEKYKIEPRLIVLSNYLYDEFQDEIHKLEKFDINYCIFVTPKKNILEFF